MGVTVAPARTAEFCEALAAGVLTADGAMGTMLAARLAQGLGEAAGSALRCLDELNLSLPALVRDVHQEFLRAGAQILGTNTFGATRERLRRFGFGDKTLAINRAGVRIAREAARGFTPDAPAFVAGIVGPTGVLLEPLGPLSYSDARLVFREQIHALVESGVDLLMLETFQDLKELEQAVLAARETAGEGMAIVAHVTAEDDGTLACGASVREFTCALDAWPVDAIGLNCCSGPRAVLETAEQMARWTAKPLSLLPSAGLPIGGGQDPYPCSPDYMAGLVADFVRAGAHIVGGCCGTTPEHIRRMRAAVRELPESVEVREPAHSIAEEPEQREEPAEPVPAASRSGLGAKLASKQFVSIVELPLPRGADPAALLAAAAEYKREGIDFAAISERPSRSSISAVAAGHLLQQEAHLECVLRLGQKDFGGLEKDLLGAHALGIHNVVCARGGGAVVAGNLNRGVDLGGRPLGSRTSLMLGVEFDMAAPDLDQELQQLELNVRAGADFVVLSPVFDPDFLDELLRRMERFGLPVIVTLRPLASSRDAEYLIHERRTRIPETYLARMRAAGPGKSSTSEGTAIAHEMAQRIREIAAGIYWTGFEGALPSAAEAARTIGLRPRD